MNATAIITLAIATFKAVPIINSWIEKLIKLWNDTGVKKSDDIRSTFKEEKKALSRAISRAETDEDIKLLSITLRSLTS